MEFQKRVNRRGDSIYYRGSLQASRIFLFIGRNNFLKDDLAIHTLMEALSEQEASLILYENEVTTIRRCMDPSGRHETLVPLIRKIANSFRLLKHPVHWKFFLPWHKRKISSFAWQSESLAQFLSEFETEQEIIVFSRSAGGIISSQVADAKKISKLVCLGYPFRNPDKAEQAERFSHLKDLKTPFLIFQGCRDAYGGEEVSKKYALSSSIDLRFLDTDHDFQLTPQEWKPLLQEIFDFIRKQSL